MVQGCGKTRKITAPPIGGIFERHKKYFEDWLFGFDKEIGTYIFFEVAFSSGDKDERQRESKSE